MFKKMDVVESIYKGIVEPFYKNTLGQTPTVIVTAGKREEKPPRHRLIL